MLEELLIKTVKNSPEKTAIVCGNRNISYGEFYAHVGRTCSQLASLAVTEGDCVAIVLPNCPQLVVSFYAVTKLRGTILPLNHLYKTEEISHYVSDSNAKIIITDEKRELFVDSCERSRFEVEFATLEEDGHSIVLEASEASRIGFDALNHIIKSLSSRICDTVF